MNNLERTMIKKRFVQFIITLLFVFPSLDLSAQSGCSNMKLMPIPFNCEISDGEFRLNESFNISINIESERLFKSAQRTMEILAGRTVLFFNTHNPSIYDSSNSSSLIINVNKIGEIKLDTDESYSLIITEKYLQLNAENDIGAIRGLATLIQLLHADEKGYYFPCVKIEDKPRFIWRGLMIDASRHFIPVDIIKNNLDAMAAVKLNVFHWHLTDDHGFRIECKSFPKLHELGSEGLYYTQEQILDVIKYASDKGIKVVPEFDLPGHATAWFIGYSELASAPGPYTIQRRWGIFDPTFDPTNEETYKFLDKFFEEMSTLFPYNYWHIGGDENNGKQWMANSKIQEFMRVNKLKDNHALQNYFNQRLEKILSKYNKTMIGWYTDEMPSLTKDYIIQSWKGRTSLYEAARRGYRSLLSHGFYIDLVQSTEYHYLNDPIPPDSILTDSVKNLILGGEATMWAEFVGPETIDSRIWPRTAAIAERLWSPGIVNNVDDMYRRLEIVSNQLEDYGLAHKKNYEMMLRRLSNGVDTEILKNFMDVTKPLYTYSRDRPHVFITHYPLTRVVDAARPDPDIARKFNRMVDVFVDENMNDPVKLNSISKWLELWKGNHANMLKIIAQSPALREIETLSEDLSKSAAIGLEAINLIKNRTKTDESWVNTRLASLKAASVPRGESELAVLKSIEKLINYVR